MATCVITLKTDELKLAVTEYLNRKNWKLKAEDVHLEPADSYARVFTTADRPTESNYVTPPCPVPGFD